MFKVCSEDIVFAAIIGERFSAAGLVVDKGFHYDGYKGFCVIFMWTIHVCIG